MKEIHVSSPLRCTARSEASPSAAISDQNGHTRREKLGLVITPIVPAKLVPKHSHKGKGPIRLRPSLLDRISVVHLPRGVRQDSDKAEPSLKALLYPSTTGSDAASTDRAIPKEILLQRELSATSAKCFLKAANTPRTSMSCARSVATTHTEDESVHTRNKGGLSTVQGTCSVPSYYAYDDSCRCNDELQAPRASRQFEKQAKTVSSRIKETTPSTVQGSCSGRSFSVYNDSYSYEHDDDDDSTPLRLIKTNLFGEEATTVSRRKEQTPSTAHGISSVPSYYIYDDPYGYAGDDSSDCFNAMQVIMRDYSKQNAECSLRHPEHRMGEESKKEAECEMTFCLKAALLGHFKKG